MTTQLTERSTAKFTLSSDRSAQVLQIRLPGQKGNDTARLDETSQLLKSGFGYLAELLANEGEAIAGGIEWLNVIIPQLPENFAGFADVNLDVLRDGLALVELHVNGESEEQLVTAKLVVDTINTQLAEIAGSLDKKDSVTLEVSVQGDEAAVDALVQLILETASQTAETKQLELAAGGEVEQIALVENDGGSDAEKSVRIQLPRSPITYDTVLDAHATAFTTALGTILTSLQAEQNEKLKGATSALASLIQKVPARFGGYLGISVHKIGDLFPKVLRLLDGLNGPNIAAARQGISTATESLQAISAALNDHAPAERTVAVTIEGPDNEISALASAMENIFVEKGKSEQARLATEYNWVAGKTTCCEKGGYNDPSGLLPSAHDVSVHSNSGGQGSIVELIGKLMGGRVQVIGL